MDIKNINLSKRCYVIIEFLSGTVQNRLQG